MASNLFTKIDTIFILYNIYIEIQLTWSGKKETKKLCPRLTDRNEDYYVSHMGIIAIFATGFVEGESA